MLLARGAVQDRPFGKTVGTIARRAVTGQLTVENDGTTYAIAFERGHVVGASPAVLADTAAAIALAHDVISPVQTTEVERWMDAVPDADEFQIIATVALLSPDEVHRLRRRVVARRASRVLALEHGDFVLTSTIALPVFPECAFHVGGVIYHAARTYLATSHLHAVVAELGTRFELRGDAFDGHAHYGFGEREGPFLRALAEGVELEAIQSIAPACERLLAESIVYALAACGTLYCEAATSPGRFARGTRNPLSVSAPTIPPVVRFARRSSPPPPRTTSPHADPPAKPSAADAFERAQAALRADRLEDAVVDLEIATQLAPNDHSYLAALAWARFCRAPDKTSIAAETRQMLNRAIARADSPVLPHYYLGMVERILNRTEKALEHFNEVLELQPNHCEAATEIRFLKRRT
jgi:tetratricopeptide (TPR) repeat protein